MTFYKAGSQWVRDVLADARVLSVTGIQLRTGGIDVPSEAWPEILPGEIASPVYCATPREWEMYAAPSDRAVVVLRDPRDIIVSLAASYRTSHAPSNTTRLLRGPIESASPSHRLLLAMFAFSSWSERLRDWTNPPLSPNVFVTTYCKLVADQFGEFARIFDFLEWSIPSPILRAVVAEHDFASRTGRAPGEENAFSHRRKGQPGDWRNHFDIETGRAFEESFPHLLSGLGYEQSDTWWSDLDASRDRAVPDQVERGQWVSVLEEFATELNVVRTAAAERLSLIESLSAKLQTLEATAAERARIIESLHGARTAVEQSWSYKLGFAPLRRLFGLFKDGSR